jgi:polyphosphate kinase 2 (PPK2 family)
VGRAARATPPGGTTATRPTDLSSLDKWDDYTRAKEHMFQDTVGTPDPRIVGSPEDVYDEDRLTDRSRDGA